MSILFQYKSYIFVVAQDIQILHRSSLRGLRQCKLCYHYNGSRALSCKNKLCALSIPKIQKRRTFLLNTVQLVSKIDTKVYSVQMRDKDTEHRNFVQIRDKTISDDDEGCIISRNAICYVDTCKYDSRDINISCKHVKSALELTPMAEPLYIDYNVWNSMALNTDVKDRLWNIYNECEYKIPMVQRISITQFAVKCDISSAFKAGRLHVSLTGGVNNVCNTGERESQKNTNDGSVTCSCACKKMKILMSPNNSIIMETDKCEHIFVTMAAIISNIELKVEFSKHIELMHDMFNESSEDSFDCSKTEVILFIIFASTIKCTVYNLQDFIKFSQSILNDCVDLADNDDLMISEALESKNSIIPVTLIPTTNQLDIDQYQDLDSSIKISLVKKEPLINDDFQSLKFIDCQIELMDEFKLTDHIDLCSNDLHLNERDIFCDEIICDTVRDDVLIGNIDTMELCVADDENLITTTNTLPLICNDNIDNKPATVAISIKAPERNRSSHKSRENKRKYDSNHNPLGDDDDGKSLEFLTWLSSIIERINMTMDFNEEGSENILTFSVYHVT